MDSDGDDIFTWHESKTMNNNQASRLAVPWGWTEKVKKLRDDESE